MNMKFIAVIPARYASTRFPGKPLAMINGRSMVMRVYEQALKAGCLSQVVVATDDDRICRHVRDEGGQALMTSPEHRSGTARVREAAQLLCGDCSSQKGTVVINIQGDEPYIDPGQIDSLAACFDDPGTGIATLIKKIVSTEDLLNPNVVKVIRGAGGHALYFSRSPIPFVRDTNQDQWLQQTVFYKHIGIYAYRADILEEICNLEAGLLEQAEGLEQLNWLEHGYPVITGLTEHESISVDTPGDLSKFTNKT